ncbi:MAG: hypothetical protein K2Y28_11235 [Burkholderiaceae bacterium]|nr:hypothetical protein [Burkholderiaceae bacterium]
MAAADFDYKVQISLMHLDQQKFVGESIFAKIKRHWQGKGTLAWAYWGFGFGGGLILLLLLSVAFLFVLPFAYSPDKGVQGSPLFSTYLAIAGCIYAAYVVATLVMVLRCGENAQWSGWKYVARVLVCIWLVNLIVNLAIRVL